MGAWAGVLDMVLEAVSKRGPGLKRCGRRGRGLGGVGMRCEAVVPREGWHGAERVRGVRVWDEGGGVAEVHRVQSRCEE